MGVNGEQPAFVAQAQRREYLPSPFRLANANGT
jgi:hypothetical protein